MDQEKDYLTVEDCEDELKKRLLKAETTEDAERLAKAISELHKVATDEMIKTESLANEIEKAESERADNQRKMEIEEAYNQEKIEVDKRRNRLTFWGAVLAALAGVAGSMGGQYVKGVMDSKYQDEGYNHEKTEAVIWNRNRHKR